MSSNKNSLVKRGLPSQTYPLRSVFSWKRSLANIPVWATPQPCDRVNSSLLWFVFWIRPFLEMTHFHSYATTGISRMHSVNECQNSRRGNSRFLVHLRGYDSIQNWECFQKVALGCLFGEKVLGITGSIYRFVQPSSRSREEEQQPEGRSCYPGTAESLNDGLHTWQPGSQCQA